MSTAKDASDQNFDYMFKILIIGNSSVGKTSFLVRYAEDSFTSAFDTAGQERYRTITTAYYRGALGFILMYDITNEDSFNAVRDWVTQIKTYSWDNAQVVLVGNKSDLAAERQITAERGRLKFFETSAKDNVNVKAVFDLMVDIILEKMAETSDQDGAMASSNAPGAKRLTDRPDGQSNGCGC
ncbi:Ras-related protein Rab-3 [Taenia crassiceps]|uniref:Ras-related protein Rab-3 n=1 Tax=Taenia crassiceps TaxID=6207 RepID=A0ABR4Q3H0_9CEST